MLAAPRTQGFCPGCGEDLIPKCGSIKVHHWSHKVADCDPWWEPETWWHREWKARVRPEATEVVIGSHRADIVGCRGGVIELQHSPISPEMIREREHFYRRMIWVIDAQPFFDNLGSYPEIEDYEGWVRWRWPRKSLMGMQRQQYWDLGWHGLARARQFKFEYESEENAWGTRWSKPCYVELEPVDLDEFLDRFLGDQRA